MNSRSQPQLRRYNQMRFGGPSSWSLNDVYKPVVRTEKAQKSKQQRKKRGARVIPCDPVGNQHCRQSSRPRTLRVKSLRKERPSTSHDASKRTNSGMKFALSPYASIRKSFSSSTFFEMAMAPSNSPQRQTGASERTNPMRFSYSPAKDLGLRRSHPFNTFGSTYTNNTNRHSCVTHAAWPEALNQRHQSSHQVEEHLGTCFLPNIYRLILHLITFSNYVCLTCRFLIAAFFHNETCRWRGMQIIILSRCIMHNHICIDSYIYAYMYTWAWNLRG